MPRRLLIDVPNQSSEKLIIDDFLIEGGILAAAALPRIVDKELALRDAGCTEGVRLNDVRARFQKPAMDVADHFWLGQREQVAVVQEALRRVFESLSSDIRFLHAIGTNRRAHRSIDDGDATVEDLSKRMLVGLGHIPLMISGSLRFSLTLATFSTKYTSFIIAMGRMPKLLRVSSLR